MGQSVKEMLIILNGQVGAGASQIGDFLSQLGSTLDIIGSKTRQFEKESVEIYRNYEDQMLAAKYALSAQVDSATELERQMKGLDEAAREWASTSIFHTDDVSKAINEAAHAGWEYEEILQGIPEAMLIAQAGGMDLSTGLDYLVKMMNATKTPMSEMNRVVDEWAMAANISATNIEELGQAFITMGSSAQFGDSTAELFSLLAALADVGTTGSQAGTALRNTMMRLIAPTTKAEAAMSLLGADAEEIQSVLADENVTKAAKTLEGLGFSAFKKDTGELKPIMDIFKELFELTDGMQEAARDELLAAIFPTRTIATALSLLAASDGELDKIYDKVSHSEGYAQKGADIMMSGLTGSIETLKSKWEEFQRSFGETLAPDIEKIAEALGGVIDGLNDLPPEVMSGLASMLTTLSAAGPLLMGVGAVAKLVGFLGPIGTAAVVAGLGVSYLFGYLSKLSEINFKENFGDLTVDLEELGAYVDGIETKFDVEQQAISKWSEAVQEAQTNYQKALNGMNEGLLKKVLTGGTFTESDYDDFVKMGEDIVGYTMQGIANAEARDQSFLEALFGDKSTTSEGEVFENTSGLLAWFYGDLEAQATAAGEKIHGLFYQAYLNGEMTPDIRDQINDQIDLINEINAEIASRLRMKEYYKQLDKASRVSWDTVSGFLEENAKKLDESKASVEDTYLDQMATVQAAFESARKKGEKSVTYTDSNGNRRTVDVTKEAEAAALNEYEREMQAALTAEESKYGEASATAIDTLMRDNMGHAWNFLKGQWASGGAVDANNPFGLFEGMGLDDLTQLASEFKTMRETRNKLKEIMNPFASDPTIYNAMRLLESMDSDSGYTYDAILARYMEEMQNMVIQGKGEWTDNGFHEYTADELAARGGAQPQEVTLDTTTAEGQVSELEDSIAGMETETEVVFGVDSSAVDSWEPPDKYGTVHYSESDETGGGTSGGGTGGGTNKATMYAEGGRATEASIFGEAGPEWAIPEQHTDRTAELLNAAREASGFTWGDLVSRYGSLNARTESSPVVLNYNPTINTSATGGLAGTLAEDKERLMRMIRKTLDEARYRESVEAYA